MIEAAEPRPEDIDSVERRTLLLRIRDLEAQLAESLTERWRLTHAFDDQHMVSDLRTENQRLGGELKKANEQIIARAYLVKMSLHLKVAAKLLRRRNVDVASDCATYARALDQHLRRTRVK